MIGAVRVVLGRDGGENVMGADRVVVGRVEGKVEGDKEADWTGLALFSLGSSRSSGRSSTMFISCSSFVGSWSRGLLGEEEEEAVGSSTSMLVLEAGSAVLVEASRFSLLVSLSFSASDSVLALFT